MARAPDVQVVARPIPLDLTAPRSNAALELADSLTGLNQQLTPLLGRYAANRQAKLSAQAEADAMANSGKAFGDAVRDGKIRPTQNPWYIQAYEEKAAQVRAQGEVSSLASQSQMWAEKDDPSAFAQRWYHEVGQIAQTYKGTDQAAGFSAAAEPVTQQALEANVKYNAQAIVEKNVQNTTQLMSAALEDVYKANPKAPAAAYYTALAPYQEQWKATGGTEEQFNDLTKGAFFAAASSVSDADVLENLKDDRGGKGALYNIVDANGAPWSAEIEQTKYRIARNQELAGMGEVHRRQAEQELEGYKVQAWAYEKYGWDLMNGKVSMDRLVEDAKAQGFSPQGVQQFFNQESRDLSSNNTYMRAQTQQYALDPDNQQKILSLRTRALKHGWSRDLEAEVWEQVRDGMDDNTANDILSKADSASKYFRSEGKADQREARAQSNFNRQMHAQASREFKDGIQESLGFASASLQASGDKSLLDATTRTKITRGATDAGNAYLRGHPEDYTGASKAADDYLDSYAKQRLARLRARAQGGIRRGTLPGVNSGGNLRR